MIKLMNHTMMWRGEPDSLVLSATYIYVLFYTPIYLPFPPHKRLETIFDKQRILQILFSSLEESTGHIWGLFRLYNLIHRLCTVMAILFTAIFS